MIISENFMKTNAPNLTAKISYTQPLNMFSFVINVVLLISIESSPISGSTEKSNKVLLTRVRMDIEH